MLSGGSQLGSLPTGSLQLPYMNASWFWPHLCTRSARRSPRTSGPPQYWRNRIRGPLQRAREGAETCGWWTAGGRGTVVCVPRSE